MSTATPLLLIDGYNYLYRAYHALPPLTNSKGESVGAIRGFLAMVKKLQAEYKPSHMALIFDCGKSFRSQLYPAYKANRPPMPDDLRSQIDILLQLLPSLGIPLLQIPEVEADDVMGTLALQASSAGMSVLLATSDKDMAQLVDAHVHLLDTMKNKRLDEKAVEEKFGVPPRLIADYLALMGDASDNIPGVSGVGPKTAAKWLMEYGSLQGVVAHADQIKGKIGEKLRAGLATLPLSRELTQIKLDCTLPKRYDELIVVPSDLDALYQWYQKLEFKTWLREFSTQTAAAPVAKSAPLPLATFHVINAANQAAVIQQIQQSKTITLIAVEDMIQQQLRGLLLDTEQAKNYMDQPTTLAPELTSELRTALQKEAIAKITFDAKRTAHALQPLCIQLTGVTEDLQLAAYVINPAEKNDFAAIADRYVQAGVQWLVQDKKNPLESYALEEIAQSAAQQAQLVQTILPLMQQQLAVDELDAVYRQIELPVAQILTQMETTGVKIDTDCLRQQSQILQQKIDLLEQRATELAGESFNLGSPKQLQEILFTKMALPVTKRTPTGMPSTDEDVLQELADQYELPAIILEYRTASKLKNTYTDRLPQQVNPQTGRIHTTYHQAVTATGRLSSSDPNLQNIPIRSAEGREIRKAFVSAPGARIIAADYSQIELRIMAHLSQDTALLQAFAEGKDIHQAAASEILGIPLEQVTSEQRRAAKATNFGLIYGMSPFGLARQLGITRSAANQYMQTYFQRYPGVQRFMEETKDVVRRQGYLTTIYGRRLYLPDIQHNNAIRRKAAERAAINAPMQGSAADIIKRAMILVDKALRQHQLAARMIMQVHDELVLEVPQTEESAVRELLLKVMPQAGDRLQIPLEVSIGVGNNWDEAH